MNIDQLRELTMGEWPVELVESDGLWGTASPQTLLFLPSFVGPTGTLLLHLLAFTHPTPWTTPEVAQQFHLTSRKTLDTLNRLESFRLLTIGSIGIEIPTRLGPLPPTLVRRHMPPKVRAAYERLAGPL